MSPILSEPPLASNTEDSELQPPPVGSTPILHHGTSFPDHTVLWQKCQPQCPQVSWHRWAWNKP